jgi:DNA-binding PadR family transcriptional regulator
MKESMALTEGVYYILLALNKPRHGYGVMQFVAELSGGRVVLAAGTLYGALANLIGRGWIRALPGESNSRKKEYVVSKAGEAVIKNEIKRLGELLENGKKILEMRNGNN